MNSLYFKIINKRQLLVLVFIFLTLALSACDLKTDDRENMRVHFLDVGQADSALIELPNGEVVLIDGGNIGDSGFLINYIKGINVEKIDYLIATHPHEDHIGGLPAVVRQFDIGKIYMPKKTANTQIFESLLKEIKNKDLKITEARSGMDIVDDVNLKLSIVAPDGASYEKINDYSIANKLKYKNISFLFTGDAERKSEISMINSKVDLKADILKVGHHGSNTSSTEEFLDNISPRYAIISCEEQNSYGHPHREVIERLNKRKIKILRTDEMGTIILETDGKSANFDSKN